MGRINDRNRHISGQQRPQPFPVVGARFRPFANEQAVACGAATCQSLKLFSERQKALFMAQVCGDPRSLKEGTW